MNRPMPMRQWERVVQASPAFLAKAVHKILEVVFTSNEDLWLKSSVLPDKSVLTRRKLKGTYKNRAKVPSGHTRKDRICAILF